MTSEVYIVSALRYKPIWSKFKTWIKPGYFSDIELRKLYCKIESLHHKGEYEVIPKEMFDIELPVVENIDTSLSLVEDFTSRIILNEIAIHTTTLLNNSSLLSLDIIGKEVDKVFNTNASVIENIEKRIVSLDTIKERKRYSFGVDFLDHILQGGVSPGELFVLSSPPFGGKTHWLVYLATAYLRQGHSVAHFILEDIPQDILEYYSLAIKDDKLCKSIIGNSLFLLNYSDTELHANDLNKVVSSLPLAEDKPVIIVVDWADLLKSYLYEDMRFKLADVFRSLRRLANQRNAILLTATQSDASAWGMKHPDMRNLSESKIGKAGVSDIVIFWSQLQEERRTGHGRLIVAKARGRSVKYPVLDIRLDWDEFEVICRENK